MHFIGGSWLSVIPIEVGGVKIYSPGDAIQPGGVLMVQNLNQNPRNPYKTVTALRFRSGDDSKQAETEQARSNLD